MAKNNRHNTAFVVGSVLGAVVGAAAALWKTPYTGEELRTKLTGGASKDSGTVVVRSESDTMAASGAPERSLKDKVIAGVEKTLAPIVGVELGKTANGGGADIRVNAEHAQTGTTVPATEVREDASTVRRFRAWKGTGEPAGTSTASTSTAADGGEAIGLSQDRVDADEWAAAYGSQGSSTAERGRTSSTSEPAPDRTADRPGMDDALTSDSVSTARDAQGRTLLGLSRDRLDAKRWAAAYEGNAGAASNGTTSTPVASSSGNQSNATRESAEETGRGAEPAFLGDDGDFVRHPPANNEAPDSSVAATGQDDTRSRSEPVDVQGAASVDELTTPQVNRVPEAARQPADRTLHPFPKLGGHEPD